MALYYHIEDGASTELCWDATSKSFHGEGGGPRLHLSSYPRVGYREYKYTDGPSMPCPSGTYLRDIFVDDKVTIPEWSVKTFINCVNVKKIHFNKETEVTETIGTKQVKKKVYASQAFDSRVKYDYHGETLWIQ